MPSGRIGEMDEVASLVAYLASEDVGLRHRPGDRRRRRRLAQHLLAHAPTARLSPPVRPGARSRACGRRARAGGRSPRRDGRRARRRGSRRASSAAVARATASASWGAIAGSTGRRSSSRNSRASASEGSAPARSSRAITAHRLASTRIWKRRSRGTHSRTSANSFAAIASSSSGAVGRSCIRARPPAPEDLKQVPLGLADPAPERGELRGRAGAGQVVVGLASADHRPLDVSHRLPPAQPLGIGPSAAGRLVGGQERLRLPQPGDREIVVAEAPGAQREPGQVLGRIAGVAELPVDHRREPVLVDDQIAEPEVPVHEPSARPAAAGSGAAGAGRPRPPAAARRSRPAPPPTGRTPRAPDRRRRRRAPRRRRARPCGSGRARLRVDRGAARARSRARRGAGPGARPRCRGRTPSRRRRPRRTARRPARSRPWARPPPPPGRRPSPPRARPRAS